MLRKLLTCHQKCLSWASQQRENEMKSIKIMLKESMENSPKILAGTDLNPNQVIAMADDELKNEGWGEADSTNETKRAFFDKVADVIKNAKRIGRYEAMLASKRKG